MGDFELPECETDGVKSMEEPGTSISAIPSVFVKLFGNLVIFGAMAAVLLFIFGVISFILPPLDLEKLDLLKPGMTREEVMEILGSPSHETEFLWTYAGWGFPMVHVFFDIDGRFESSEYDP